ncbi:MAG: hypothetical protein ABIP71_01040, partial [Verrucomicrobiota bacterium]
LRRRRIQSGTGRNHPPIAHALGKNQLIVVAETICCEARLRKTEKEFPGTTSAEWLESWCVNRVLLAPLTENEKKLDQVIDAKDKVIPK